MQKTVFILLLFLFSFSGFAQVEEANCRISVPDNVLVNSSFDLSIITNKNFNEADKLKLYLFPDGNLEINKINVRYQQQNLKQPFSLSYIDQYDRQGYKSIINLNDSTLSKGEFFQIILNLKSGYSNSSSFKLVGIYTKEDSILGYLNISKDNNKTEDNNLISADIDFYKSQGTAGNAILFNNGASLDFSLSNFMQNRLLIEFWFRISEPDLKFLTIKNDQNPSLKYELQINHFQMLTVNDEEETMEFLNPVFLSKKIWYHISVLLDSAKNTLSFFCNEIPFAKVKFPDFTKSNGFNFSFFNNNDRKAFEVDLMRIINFNNSIEVASNNRNYNNFLADSSRTLAQLKFNDKEELQNYSKLLNLEYTDIQWVYSEAPIFARAPELNLNLFGNTYELEWSGGDFKQADRYILQKSSNGNDYVNVSKISAENSIPKTYSVIDQKDENNEIVFYRVKQINKDGSIVYSSQVKVGQGLSEPFIVEQNFPNPFNPKTSIEVELLEDNEITIVIYNLEGREVTQLFKGFLTKGIHKFSFDATNFPSGIYLYKVSTPNFNQTKKMILTK